jgi:hypothetical protein
MSAMPPIVGLAGGRCQATAAYLLNPHPIHESRICQRATGSKAVEFQSRVKRVQRVQGAAICI